MSESELIDVSVAQDGGIMKKIIKAAPDGAKGPPPDGYEVTAHYTGSSCLTCIFLSRMTLSFVD